MSFILDALRKSEHERQRTAAPGIANVPFGAPRKVLPLWAVTLMVVLALAVLGLGGAWLRSEWSAGARQARSAAPAEAPSTPPASMPRNPTTERPTLERPAQLAERSLARESGRSSVPQPQSSLRGPTTSNTSSIALRAPSSRNLRSFLTIASSSVSASSYCPEAASSWARSNRASRSCGFAASRSRYFCSSSALAPLCLRRSCADSCCAVAYSAVLFATRPSRVKASASSPRCSRMRARPSKAPG